MITHRAYSGWFPFDILDFDRTTKPGMFPFQPEMRYMARWWWDMTKMRVQATIKLSRSMKNDYGPGEDQEGNPTPHTSDQYDIDGTYHYDQTLDVVPTTCTLDGQRVAPGNLAFVDSRAYDSCINFDTSKGPMIVPLWGLSETDAYTDSSGAVTTGMSDRSFTPELFLGLFPAVAATYVGESPKSPVILDTTGAYWPAFIFAVRGGYLANDPLRNMPDFLATTWKATPAPLNSGGNPSAPGFGGGIPFGEVGVLKIHEAGGTIYPMSLYGYSGTYVNAADGSTDSWSGSDSLVVTVDLTPKYPEDAS